MMKHRPRPPAACRRSIRRIIADTRGAVAIEGTLAMSMVIGTFAISSWLYLGLVRHDMDTRNARLTAQIMATDRTLDACASAKIALKRTNIDCSKIDGRRDVAYTEAHGYVMNDDPTPASGKLTVVKWGDAVAITLCDPGIC